MDGYESPFHERSEWLFVQERGYASVIRMLIIYSGSCKIVRENNVHTHVTKKQRNITVVMIYNLVTHMSYVLLNDIRCVLGTLIQATDHTPSDCHWFCTKLRNTSATRTAKCFASDSLPEQRGAIMRTRAS